MSVTLLEPKFVPKIWGSTQLEPWYPNAPEKIGEVWYPLGSLLLKFLFTTENLSVQVHPGDEYAAEHHGSLGKTEMWHVLRAENDAAVALGFVAPLSGPGHLRSAAESGELMNLLRWVKARPGDTFFVPAGTVHAIGAGLVLVEIQQNSDVTYRLFDYGRDRELHLDHGVRVSHLGTHPGAEPPRALSPQRTRLAESPYFSTDLVEFTGPQRLEDVGDAIVVLAGEGVLDGRPFRPGQVFQFEGNELHADANDGCRLLFVRSR